MRKSYLYHFSMWNHPQIYSSSHKQKPSWAMIMVFHIDLSLTVVIYCLFLISIGGNRRIGR